MSRFNYPDNSKFKGIDISLEISLEEYGFIARHTAKDYSDEYFIIYDTHNGYFDNTWIRESFLDDLIDCKEWADEEDVESMLSYVGCESKEEWHKNTFANKLSDCLYWGVDNIFGSSYCHIEDEAVQRWINNSEWA